MKNSVVEWLEGLCRVALGVLFVYSSWSKIADPGLFANIVMKYELLPECMVGLFSLILPMVELLAGLAIMFSKWMRESALLIASLLLMFIAALASALARGLEIDCGCFGVPSVGGRTELLLAIGRDVVLLVPAVWLTLRRNAWMGLKGWIVLVAVLLIYGVWTLGGWPLAGKTAKDETPPPVKPVQSVAKKHHKSDVRRTKAKPVKARRQIADPTAWQVEEDDGDDDDSNLSPENKKLKEAIEAAEEKEDLAAARSLAATALASDSVEVRQAMVDTLGGFGVKALPELTPFMADADDDVRDSAFNEWSMAVSQMENDADKVGVVELAMHVLTNEDSLEEISGEYIGVDEKLAVNSLLRIIEAGGSEQGIAKAKETYEFVTGDEFVDRATAEKWLREEYKPSDVDTDD